MDRKRILEIMNADADYPSEQYVHMMGDYGGITGGELRELCRLALQAKRGRRLLKKSALLLDTKSPGCPEHWDDKAWPLADEIRRHLYDTE